MPPPPKQRTNDCSRALVLMVEALGDNHRRSFDPCDPMFEGLLESTWTELLRERSIVRAEWRHAVLFRLTPLGWRRGLLLSGALERPDIRDRLIRIRAELKRLVDGRHGQGIEVDVRDLAKDLRLPVGWVSNALGANLLSAVFAKHFMTATINGTSITVPTDFDLPKI